MTSEKEDFIEIACPAGCGSKIKRFPLNRKLSIQAILKKVCYKECCDALEQGTMAVGIYGERVCLEDTPGSGDRLEIYRPLVFDTLTARQQRLIKKK